MRTIRRVGLLFWKNITLRKRHYIVTGFEIVLPTLFAILLAFIKTKIGAFETYDPEESWRDAQHYQEYSEQKFLEPIWRDFIDYDPNFPIAGFAPNNTETREIIGIIEARIQDYYANQNDTSGCQMNSNSCNIVEWKGFDDEAALEAYAISLMSANFGEYEQSGPIFKIGIVFTTDLTKPETTKFAYKLRKPCQYQCSTTSKLFDSYSKKGPGYSYSDYYYDYSSSSNNGFVGMQFLLDKAIIEWKTGKLVDDFELSVQPFPYPRYDSFDVSEIYLMLPQFIIMGFIFVIPSIIRTVVSEKETGIRELMNLMGLPRWMHWLGYMVNSLVVLLLSITIVTLMFFVAFKASAGAVMVHTDPTLFWFMMLLYVISTTSVCFFISSFFQRTTIAITVGIVVYIVSYYALSYALDEVYEDMGLAEKMITCLIPNMALHYAMKVMTGLEAKAIGAKWSNLGQSASETDTLCVYHVLIMFVVNSLLYIMLSLYVEQVIPSKYGVRRPWYYIFQLSEWGIGKKEYVPSAPHGSDRRKSLAYEPEPDNMKVGIEIKNLRKVFSGNKVAVDNLSVRMYEGQITALLGQNGAGKTTTMSILTGMFGPSSGTAYVNGHDITSDMDSVRDSVALCPQHNMLFNQLTVLEHLIFFGRLRGLSASKARTEAKELLVTLKLEDKRHALSMSLSGGQKRKLSLGCALITGAKVLILDEPTSGMDVENRRKLWDLLLYPLLRFVLSKPKSVCQGQFEPYRKLKLAKKEFRGKRTIVLTTHFMEEADVLGDRIAIMDNGKLQCCGTPMFLKKYYGAGYVLKMILTSSANHSNILSAVQNHVPDSSLSLHGSGHPSELSVVIPTATTAIFPGLFDSLTSRKAELGITAFGLTQTTMDDVFVRVGELSQIAKEKEEALMNPDNNNVKSSNVTDEYSSEKVTGLKLAFQQFLSVIKKKMLYSLRKKRIIFGQFILPILLLIAGILVSNTVFKDNNDSPPLKMTISSYPNSITPYSFLANPEVKKYAEAYNDLLRGSTSLKLVGDGKMNDHLLEVGERDLITFRDRYIIGAVLNETHLKAIHSTLASHSPPLAVNSITNTLLRIADPGSNSRIEVTNHPIRNPVMDLNQNSYVDGEMPSIVMGMMITVGLALVTSSFVILPIEERRCAAKQLQLMTGLSHSVYWGASFVCDFFFLILLICLMTAFLPILEKYNSFTNNNGAGVAFLIMLVYGFESISFSYLISLFTNTVPGGFSLLTIIQILTGTGIQVVVVAARGDPKTRVFAKVAAWIGRFFPSFGLASSITEYTEIAFENLQCEMFPEDYRDQICVANNNGGQWMLERFRQCCENCVELGVECFKTKSYLVWSVEKIPCGNGQYCYDSETGRPGIIMELTCMLIMGVVYHLVLLAIEKGLFKKYLSWSSKADAFAFKSNSKDEDVSSERNRVESLVASGETSNDALVVQNFCKSFGTFSAASNVSFGVHHGECFGLLGVNGAGKTTTFRMLTGDETRSDGNAYSLNYTLDSDRNGFLKNMGYCPQFDGIVDVLTGMDMLELFASLRGIPRKYAKKEAEKWILKMGLNNSGNVQSQKYSGGMKRRLCSAIAMIGDPKIVLLDECTTGVDPVARRDFWKIISASRNAGQAIVLTSHSMEECEALCSRLAIMVNGEFQCLGPVQHLKNKYAQGYSLTLKLSTVELDQDVVRALQDRIYSSFQPCMLKDQHQNIIRFQLSNTQLEWGFLFKTMDALRTEFESILEEYSINETTLEEVFLAFARQQYPERKADVSWFKKCISCQCTSK